MEVVVHTDAVVAGFRVELAAPLGTEGQTRATVDAWFDQRIRSQYLRRRNTKLIEAEERIVADTRCDTGLSELLRSTATFYGTCPHLKSDKGQRDDAV